MCRDPFILVILIKMFVDDRGDLFGLVFVFEHFFKSALFLVENREANLQNDSSSRVRPAVSGKKK